MKKYVLLVILLVTTFFLLTFKNTQVPPGINGDESGIGYNAILLSRNLKDENANFLPLFIYAKGSDWKQPVTVYTTAFIFALVGPSYFWLRATSTVFVLLSLVILFFISKYFKSSWFFPIAALILVTTPIGMIQSHLALENIAPLPFILFWLLMLLGYRDSPKRLFLVLGGASLGIGMFSYLGMRLVVPVLIMVTLVFLGKHFRKWLYFLGGYAPFALLMAVAYFRYPSAVIGNFQSNDPFSIYDFLYRWLSVFDISFLFFKGDLTPIHSTGHYGMILLATLPLFLVGIYQTLTTKDSFNNLVLAAFFLAPVFFGFIPDVHRASRLLALLPFYVFISTLGFLAFSKKLQVIFVFLILINFALFTADYWYSYPDRVKKAFPVTIDQTYEFRYQK